jgi:transcriptional regulator with XRE-family HTH domain
MTWRKIEMNTITLGSFIRNRRELLGKTLRGLAVELDIAAPYLHDIEKGNRTPSEKLLPAFIRCLYLSPDDETTLYDLVGGRRQGIYPDLTAYIQQSDLARGARRKARDCNISDTMWIKIIDSIENGG